MIELASITPEDWAKWRGCRLRALSEDPHAFGSRFDDWKDATETRWRERLNLKGSINILAWDDGEAVGMVSGTPAPEAFNCELISMWVAPEARGNGVGNILIAAVQKWAEDQNARELYLDVFENNVRAIALYIRNGFLDIGPSSDARERRMVMHLAGARRS